MQHTYPIRVYYFDVDYVGVVHHANYLKFMETARTEWFRELSLGLMDLHDLDVFFAVTHVDINYKAPAFLDDHLQVVTKLVKLKPASIHCEHVIERISPNPGLIMTGNIQLATVDRQLKPIRVPKIIVEGVNSGG